MIINVSCGNFNQSVRNIFLDNDHSIVRVMLGEGSYLVKDSLEIGGYQCYVLIGKYAYISYGIKFILGLNHCSSSVSTYPFLEVFEKC